jgi:DNA replication and repair protein RecF
LTCSFRKRSRYLPLLQRYLQAVRSRNALLKQQTPDPVSLDSFSEQLVKLGNELIRARRELIPKLSPLARLAYRRISNDAEELRIEYQPTVKADFAVELAQSGRERAIARPSSARIGTTWNCCSTGSLPGNSAAKARSARWPSR